MQPVNYIEKGFGLHEVIQSTGHTLVEQDGVWLSDDPVAVQAIIDAYDDVAETQGNIRTQINARRDLLEVSGFPYLGKVIDSDTKAVERISVAALTAMACLSIGQAYTVEWTCADNSKLPLDAQGVIGMVAALATYGKALHDHATALKDAVMASDDPSSIDISTGWPP